MHHHFSWLQLDRLARQYAAARVVAERAEAVGVELARGCEVLARRPLTMLDLSTFCSSRVSASAEVSRQVAWVGQHVFECRAWCVGERIVEPARGSGRVRSALVEQLGLLGVATREIDGGRLNRVWRRGPVRQDRLDAMFYSAEGGTAYLVKGQSSTRAQQISPGFRLAKLRERETLYGRDDAVITGVFASTDGLAGLGFAIDVVQQACPGIAVRGFYMTAEDPGGAGRFQVHEIPAGSAWGLTEQKTLLDPFPVVATHEHHAEALDEDPGSLLMLPTWPVGDAMERVPVDVPTRCAMVLRWFAHQQRERPAKLFLASQNEASAGVAAWTHVRYPRSLGRLDIDTLQRLGLLDWSPDGSASVGLTPAGVARVEALERALVRDPARSPARLLGAVAGQEGLWGEAVEASAPGGACAGMRF